MYLYLILGFIFILHYFFDTHYFVRVFFHCFCARFLYKKLPFLEPSAIYGICMTSDVDMMLNHMNNSRYLREFDFGRMDYGFRSRLMIDFLKRGGNFLVCGVSIRYRLSLKIFSLYKVVTTPVWWDNKFMYFDQRVVTLSDGIVRAVAYTKIATVIDMSQYLEEAYPDLKKPEMTEDLQKWIESQDISRNNMKKIL